MAHSPTSIGRRAAPGATRRSAAITARPDISTRPAPHASPLRRDAEAARASGARTIDVHRLGVAAFVLVWCAAAARFVMAEPAALGWAAPLGGAIGYLLADLLAGLVHWIADRHFGRDTPVLGPTLIAPFRDHHADAVEMSRHGFCEVSGHNAIATLPLALALLATPSPDGFAGSLLGCTGLALTLALFLTNQFHAWAHAETPPAFARRLQRLGLILTPERHARHHRAGHDRAYCVTSGWLNPPLDRLRLFDRLERAIGGRRSSGR